MIDAKVVTPDEAQAKAKKPKRGVVLAPDVRRVTCPLCSIGWADVVIYKRAGEYTANVTEPRRCNWCRRNFKLEWLLQLVGRPMPGEPGPTITPE